MHMIRCGPTIMSREKIIDRIRKLLELSKSNNEHEAAAAAERASVLMLEYQISLVSLDSLPTEPIGKHSIESGNRTVSWKGSLANGVAQSYGCRMYWRKAEIIIVGRTSDVAAVRYTYQYLAREVNRLAERAWKQTQTFDSARRWKHAFRVGAAQTIKQRLIGARRENMGQQASQARTPATVAALMRIAQADEGVAAYYEEVTRGSRRVRVSASSHWGYSAGCEAGQTLRLGHSSALSAPARQLKARGDE